MLFTELPLCEALQEGLQAMNFKETTPVQEQAIPVILEKKDVIACAQTGTGKTAAFLLPLLNNLQTDSHDENKINAIVMAPTRELAQQIDRQMEGFSYFTPSSSVAVYGGNDGEAWDLQRKGLTSGADVVIATPGRLLSHINLYNVDFSGVKYFILDEADRMLDMGFHDDIMKIEKLLPKERQTVMFSATMPHKIQQLAKTILRDPTDISIAISRPPETILQSAYVCHEGQKINIVKHLFREKTPNKVILFSGSKQKVKQIAKTLAHMGLSVGEMHSDLDQPRRDHVMHEFKNERVSILVATDIVARGIDIDDISLVINFDVPYDAEDYVHRIGRTARAGDSGMAITFVSPDEQYRFSKIEEFLGKRIYRIPVPPELGEAPEYNPVRDNRKGGGKKGKNAGKSSGRQKSAGNMEDSEKNGASRGARRSGKPEKFRESGEQIQSEKPESVGMNGKPERTERTARGKRIFHPKSSIPQQESDSSKGNLQEEQTNGQQNTCKKRRGPKREAVAPSQPETRRRVPGGEREQESSSPEQRNPKRLRKRVPRDTGSPSACTAEREPSTRNAAETKKTSAPHKPEAAMEQTTEPKKSKRWSWWPFGKKRH